MNSEVPPTPMAQGEEAGYSTMPSSTGSPTLISSWQDAPPSPEEVKKLMPSAAPASMAMSSSSMAPSRYSSVSQPPIDMLISLTRSSLTARSMSAVRSASSNDGAAYMMIWRRLPAMPEEDWL